MTAHFLITATRAIHQTGTAIIAVPEGMKPDAFLAGNRDTVADLFTWEADRLNDGDETIEPLSAADPRHPEHPDYLAPGPNAYQAAAAKAYMQGTHAHVLEVPPGEFMAAVEDTQDNFFRYIIRELDAAEDCDSSDEAIRRTINMQHDLEAVLDAVRSIED